MNALSEAPQARSVPGTALAQVVSDHLPTLLSTAKAILKSDDVAMDVVQETLTKIWYRGWLPSMPEPALVRLVKLASLHQARCQRRRTAHEEAFASFGSPCCHEDPLSVLVGRETGETVREALGEIQDHYRVVFESYELEGLSYEEIAERLDVPIGTVRSRLRRARLLLRERLKMHFEAA